MSLVPPQEQAQRLVRQLEEQGPPQGLGASSSSPTLETGGVGGGPLLLPPGGGMAGEGVLNLGLLPPHLLMGMAGTGEGGIGLPPAALLAAGAQGGPFLPPPAAAAGAFPLGSAAWANARQVGW